MHFKSLCFFWSVITITLSQEQIQAIKADRDSKSQEAQRLREEIHEAKEAADDQYQALSATCVQNQQTCESMESPYYVLYLVMDCCFVVFHW